MKSTVFLVLSFFILCTAAPAKNEHSKYLELKKKMVNSQITLNDDTYTEYILRGNRDFDAFVLYTTLGNQFSCRLCPITNAEFARVAKAYEALETKADRNVLFIRVPIDTCSKVFLYHNIMSAPIISYISASDVIGKQLNSDNDFQLEYPIRAENIASFVRSKVHVLVEIKRFPWPQVIIACLFIFGLPIIAYIYLFKNEQVYRWLSNAKIYMVISLLIYAVAVMGIVYDIIHNPPFLNCDQTGCSMFLTQGQNMQTVSEGLLTGSLLIACSWSIVKLIEGLTKSSDSEAVINKYVTILAVCFTAYLICFCIRTPWYPSVFWYRG